MSKKLRSLGRGVAVLGLVGLVALLAGCGGASNTARSAAEEELPGDEVVVVDDAADTDATDSGDTTDTDTDADAQTDTDTEPADSDAADNAENPIAPAEPENLFERVTAGNLGTQVCVFNDTGEVEGISVEFTKSDTSSNGPLSRWGMSMRCGEGTFFVGDDVAGKIYFSKKGAANYEFDARNPWAGLPNGGFRQATGKSNGCVGSEFQVGASGTYDDGLYSITMSRDPDYQWKQFLITIRPSSKPSSDGQARACPTLPSPAVVS